MKESCVDSYDSINCEAAYLFCQAEISVPFHNTGLFTVTQIFPPLVLTHG